MVLKCVHAIVPVKRYTVSSNKFFSLENVTLVPGEVYPEDEIHIIEVEADGLLTSRLVHSMTDLFVYIYSLKQTRRHRIQNEDIRQHLI
jgi:hypothetical protein